jgi:nickel-dependent lactate racemase
VANSVKLPQYSWYDPREVEYPLPENWQVTVHNIAGYNRPALKADEIRKAVTSPIGMPPLRELAKGRQEVAILFDDLTRCTRVYEIVPFVLEELAEAGITDDRIRFIAAVANHQALDRSNLVKKLGEDVLRRFPVYNHCPFMNCTDIGTTSYGTRVFINAEVLHCDLKISIGQIVPHPQYGFSGGAKIILPGVASYETVVSHHGVIHEPWKAERRKQGLPSGGYIEDSPVTGDAREVAKTVGLDMIVNCLVNLMGETAAVYAGALEPAYAEALQEAKSHYLSVNTRDSDIVIANAFDKAAEYSMAMSSAIQALKPDGGDVVIITNSPSGQDVHYLFDSFGKTISGSLGRSMTVPPHINNLIIYTEFPELRILDRYSNRDKVRLMSDWTQVIETLVKNHGAGTKVAVYPSADIQYFGD